MISENSLLKKSPEDIRQTEEEVEAVEVTGVIHPLRWQKLLDRVHDLEEQLKQPGGRRSAT
jgi:hypothetical protein